MNSIRPDASGILFQDQTQAVFLIDPEGYKRLIPDTTTLHRLFGPNPRIVADDGYSSTRAGPDFTKQAKLVQGNSTEAHNVYFADQPVRGSFFFRYRWIPSNDAMGRYRFDTKNIDKVTTSQSEIDQNTDPRFWA
jgi:hypothetical protein